MLPSTRPPQAPQSHQAAQLTPPLGQVPVPPPKITPDNPRLKALPTVKYHTTDQLNEAKDEYVPLKIDEFGEKKIMGSGELLGGRTYRCRIFPLRNRGDKRFMLTISCARALRYRDSYDLLKKNRSLCKIIASQADKDDLIKQGILSDFYRSRHVAFISARSAFRQFGSRIIEDGRRVQDDYWEQTARKQGFTESDLPEERSPGAAKARRSLQPHMNVAMPAARTHTGIAHNNQPDANTGPRLPPITAIIGALGTSTSTAGSTHGPGPVHTTPRNYGGIAKGGHRQEPTGLLRGQIRESPLGGKRPPISAQRDASGDYIESIQRRPPAQPPFASTQLAGSADAIPASRPAAQPHVVSGITELPAVCSQTPQMKLTAVPYSPSSHAKNQQPLRNTSPFGTPVLASLPSSGGSTSSIGHGTSHCSYQPGSTWPSQPQPQPQQYGHGSYAVQNRLIHPSQPAASHMRQHSGQMLPATQFAGTDDMQYGEGSTYPTQQWQYVPQDLPGSTQVYQSHPGPYVSPQHVWTPQKPPR